jgi:hypothetical protein
MTMTEPFATSVAAVAPVLLLLGVIEMATASRREGGVLEARAAALEASLRLIAEDGYADPERLRREVKEALTGHPPIGWRNVARTLLWGGWAFCALLQLGALVFAMRWLAIPNAGPDEDVALVCYLALCVGAAWVVAVPLILTVVEFIRTDRREARLERQMDAFLDVTRELYGADDDDRQP